MKKILLCFIFVIFCSIFSYSQKIASVTELINQKKYSQAIEILKLQLSENPNSVELNLTLGLLYLEIKDYNSAEIYLTKTTYIDQNCLSAHYSLAMIYEKTKKYNSALSEWNIVLSISSDKSLQEIAKKHIDYIQQQTK